MCKLQNILVKCHLATYLNHKKIYKIIVSANFFLQFVVLHFRTSNGGEPDRKSIQQLERVHRPIKLKEMPLPNMSPATERRSPRITSPSAEKKPGKERMEHWV